VGQGKAKGKIQREIVCNGMNEAVEKALQSRVQLGWVLREREHSSGGEITVWGEGKDYKELESLHPVEFSE